MSLPVEIWQTILRYCISVETFFETDPVETCGIASFITRYQDETAYWRSERRRNKLRRVCSTWNLYLALERFKHRYVRLQDVQEAVVPISAISQAIRLENYVSPRNGGDFSYGEVLLQKAISRSPEAWFLEILDGGIIELNEVLLLSGKAPRIKSIIRVYKHILEQTKSLLPNLCLLVVEGIIMDHTSSQLEFPSLTTLYTDEMKISSIQAWKLPSLRHLSFRVDDLTAANFIELLRAIGKNLLTLFDVSTLSDQYLPNEIWALCPRLQQLQTSFMWASDSKIPISLETIRLPLGSLGWSTEEPSLRRFPASAVLQAKTKMVTFDWRWWEAIQFDETCIEYLLFGLEYGITLHDQEGVSVQEFMVALLSFCWKRSNLKRPWILRSVSTIRF